MGILPMWGRGEEIEVCYARAEKVAMNEMIELENVVSDEGISSVHLMSNFELTVDAIKKYHAPVDAKIEITNEMGVHHLRASWNLRGPIQINAEGWSVPRIFVIWSLMGYESVKAAIHDAAKYYEELYGMRPDYAYMRQLPRGVENCTEIGDLILYEVDWMVRKCVAVGWTPIGFATSPKSKNDLGEDRK
jgi:hypothetical protein